MERLLGDGEIIQEGDEYYTHAWQKVPEAWEGKTYKLTDETTVGRLAIPVKREVPTDQMNHCFDVLIEKMEIQITESGFILRTLKDMQKLFTNMF